MDRSSALLSGYFFLVVTSIVIGKAVRDALFLSHFTVMQMTYADLQTIVAIAITMALYLRLQRWLTVRTVLMASSACFVLTDLACWWGARAFPQPWLTRTIYFVIGIQAAIMPSQVSVLARRALTVRQAKRVFGVIGSGAILGWIVGGLVTRAAATRAGTEPLLIVMAGFTALCPILTRLIWREDEAVAPQVDRDSSSPPVPGLLPIAAVVWRSPHLRAIACLVFLSAAASTVAGQQFRAIASESIAGTDRLTAFFGSFTFHAGLISLATHVLLTSRLLQCVGVGTALAIAPLALATGSVGVLIWGTLGAAVFLKGSDQVLRYSIDRAAVELLYAPLSPHETFQAKTFIDAVVFRIGDGAGAFAVIFGAKVLHLGFARLSVISLCLLLGWVGAATCARHGYIDHLLRNLRQRRHVTAETRMEIVNDGSESPATDLAAEIVGLYCLVESWAHASRPAVAETPEYRQSVTRIFRLLKMLSPGHDLDSALAALESVDGVVRASALEYLENILKPCQRKLLIPLLERDL